jgi:hypothetical protein
MALISTSFEVLWIIVCCMKVFSLKHNVAWRAATYCEMFQLELSKINSQLTAMGLMARNSILKSHILNCQLCLSVCVPEFFW